MHAVRTVTKRGRTWQNLNGLWMPENTHASGPSHYGPPPSFVTAYYVLSRFFAFTSFYYGLFTSIGFSSAPWLPWQIFWQFKNLARHPRQSRPVTFAHPVPRVISRPSRFVHGVHDGLKRDCYSITVYYPSHWIHFNVALTVHNIHSLGSISWLKEKETLKLKCCCVNQQ